LKSTKRLQTFARAASRECDAIAGVGENLCTWFHGRATGNSRFESQKFPHQPSIPGGPVIHGKSFVGLMTWFCCHYLVLHKLVTLLLNWTITRRRKTRRIVQRNEICRVLKIKFRSKTCGNLKKRFCQKTDKRIPNKNWQRRTLDTHSRFDQTSKYSVLCCFIFYELGLV